MHRALTPAPWNEHVHAGRLLRSLPKSSEERASLPLTLEQKSDPLARTRTPNCECIGSESIEIQLRESDSEEAYRLLHASDDPRLIEGIDDGSLRITDGDGDPCDVDPDEPGLERRSSTPMKDHASVADAARAAKADGEDVDQREVLLRRQPVQGEGGESTDIVRIVPQDLSDGGECRKGPRLAGCPEGADCIEPACDAIEDAFLDEPGRCDTSGARSRSLTDLREGDRSSTLSLPLRKQRTLAF